MIHAYTYTEAEDMFFIGVYVDEIILAGCSDKKIREVKGALAFKFDIKDMGNYTTFGDKNPSR